MNTERETLYHAKRGRIFLYFALTMAMVIIGFQIMSYDFKTGWQNELASIIGPITILFFGFVALAMSSSVLKNGPSLTLSPEGLHLGPVGSTKTLRIAWTDIRQCVQVTAGGKSVIGIDTHNEAELIAQLSPIQKILAKSNQNSGHPALSIPQDLVDAPLNQVLEVIRAYHSRYGSIL